jgi:hypothetical protein
MTPTTKRTKAKLEEARRRWGTAELVQNPTPTPAPKLPPAAPAVAQRMAA